MSAGEGDSGDLARLVDEVATWASESRTEHEAGGRRRRAWLGQLSAETTTWSSLVLGWTERRALVSLTTISAKVHHGVLRAVGHDFVMLSPITGSATSGAVLVPTAAIAYICRSDAQAVETGPVRQRIAIPTVDSEGVDRLGEGGADHQFRTDHLPSTTAKDPALIDLAGALSEMAASRPRVRIIVGAGISIMGELRWVGSDLVCLRSDSSPPKPTYVRIGPVVEVSVLEA